MNVRKSLMHLLILCAAISLPACNNTQGGDYAATLMTMYESALDGDWDKVSNLASEDHHNTVGTYYYNLSNAMKGCLADSLMSHYQPFELGLFIPAAEGFNRMEIYASGEVWFRLGDMTMAEHSTILSMLFSHDEPQDRFWRRMAEINLINEDDAAALKYLRLLREKSSSRRWAESHWPGRQSLQVQKDILNMRTIVPTSDTLRSSYDVRASLVNLLEANPDNSMAREYLLCYDLLTKDLESFIHDYDPTETRSRLYDEAVLIYLAATGQRNEHTTGLYGIPDETVAQFNDFTTKCYQAGGSGTPLTALYGKTYWYFFRYAQWNENQ